MSEKDSPETGQPLSRRKYLLAFGTTIGAVAGLTLSSTPSEAQGSISIYSGVANTIVLAGDGATVTQQTYQRNVIVVFDLPRQGGLTETNPFNLYIGPADRNETGLPGHYEIHSAAVVDNNLFQFWEIERQDSNTFAGILTNPFNAEALVWNIINFDLALIPGRPNLGVLTTTKGMGAGTQLVGAGDESTVDIQLQGATIDQFTQFGSRISATRIA